MTEKKQSPRKLAAERGAHRLEASGTLEQRLNEWMHDVLAAYEAPGMSDTLQMIVDVDCIIADEFNHTPVLEENQNPQTAKQTM